MKRDKHEKRYKSEERREKREREKDEDEDDDETENSPGSDIVRIGRLIALS